MPASRQQKYCDHGLSVAVLATTCPIWRARSSWANGGKTEIGVDFLRLETTHRLRWRQDDEVDVLLWVQTQRPDHGGEEDVARDHVGDGEGLPLEVTDGTHRITTHQLEAADVATSEDGYRVTGVDAGEERPGEVHGDVRLAGTQTARGPVPFSSVS